MSLIDQIPEQYRLCRDVLHSWRPYDARTLKNTFTGRREIHRELRCTRCKVRKTQRLAVDGTLIPGGTSYNYTDAEGYVLKGQGHMNARDRGKLRTVNVELFTHSGKELT